MSNTYIVKTREELFKELKEAMKDNRYIKFTDEQFYFMVDEHIKAMKEQGYILED